eukprot:CAMPEP_0204188516 /NCGR_PEP_ID=MMETSP0361-20130328/57697_1 /ASSEMBLY_ACC=CAM_ASM_000343 /TAXON_ID=268821 /ORGANISM="Scrippsiella Hangoei, Strain SHTV-5" /LENGTH=109 /DNA_ID=CAMNT_0051149077 /DNA_START=71 /DNA_END=397 /DNA_ORIENTATION=-
MPELCTRDELPKDCLPKPNWINIVHRVPEDIPCMGSAMYEIQGDAVYAMPSPPLTVGILPTGVERCEWMTEQVGERPTGVQSDSFARHHCPTSYGVVNSQARRHGAWCV